jgi:acetyl-CoA carboxylase biotin carboxyl carrier protein
VSLSNEDVLAILALLDASRFEELLVETSDYKLHVRRAAPDRNGAPSDSAPAPDARSDGASSVSPASRPSPPPASPPLSTSPPPSGPPQPSPASPPSPPSPYFSASVTDTSAAAYEAAVDVKAPLLGTFYGAPQPGAAPFVAVGDVVEETTVVAIVEVMKLMNSVCAGTSGIVIEILARDGQLVEYGEPLMRVAPAQA